MGHNGGRYQSQGWFLNEGGCWPFMNKVKCSDIWVYTTAANGRPAASIINANGYPTSVLVDSLKVTVQDEGLTFRPGKRILSWTGNQTFTVGGATLSSGSLTGNNGRAVMTMADSTSPRIVNITLTATDGNLTNLVWLHEDDEASYLSQKAAFPNREPFGTKFLQNVAADKVGVWRFLDWQNANASNVFKWSHRTPVDHYSYYASQYPPSLYGGALGGGSTNFTATVSGYVLGDGSTVVVDIAGATTASGTTTLNVSGTGAKPIKTPDGLAWARSSTGTDRRATFTYIAILDAYILFNTAVFNEGVIGGVPPEVCIDLCNALQCHGHFIPPPLTCDTPSDYMTSLAADGAARLNSGLQFRSGAGPNELWNTGFSATGMASLYALARYSANNVNDWYGRSGALIGSIVKSAFGGDRSRYAVLCEFQTTQAPDNVSGANTSRRIESTRHVAAGGTPASNFITHVVFANYFTTMRMFAGTVGTTAEQYLRFIDILTKSREWKDGDATAKQTAIDWVFGGTASADWINSELKSRLDTFHAVAQNYTVFGTSEKLKLGFYEGMYYPGDISANAIHGIDGVTLGTTTVIAINKINSAQAHAFVAGMTAQFRNIGGTTQLNGISPATVLSVTDHSVTLDLDSSTFGTFTSGGSGTFAVNDTAAAGIIYVGYGGPVTAPGFIAKFENASKAATGSLYAAQLVLNLIATYPEAEYPADYFYAGPDNQWSKYQSLYDVPSPQQTALTLFSNRLRRHQLTAAP